MTFALMSEMSRVWVGLCAYLLVEVITAWYLYRAWSVDGLLQGLLFHPQTLAGPERLHSERQLSSISCPTLIIFLFLEHLEETYV